MISGEAPPFILLGVAIGMATLVLNGLGFLSRLDEQHVRLFRFPLLSGHYVTMRLLGGLVLAIYIFIHAALSYKIIKGKDWNDIDPWIMWTMLVVDSVVLILFAAWALAYHRQSAALRTIPLAPSLQQILPLDDEPSQPDETGTTN